MLAGNKQGRSGPSVAAGECSLHFLGPSTHLRVAIRGLEWDGVSQATKEDAGKKSSTTNLYIILEMGKGIFVTLQKVIILPFNL